VYYEIIRDAVYNLSALAPSFRDAPAYNDHWDDCFSTVTEDGVIFLNLEPVAVEKTAFGRTLSIEPNAIAIISADVPGWRLAYHAEAWGEGRSANESRGAAADVS
jgi:hypothetical protein